MKITIETGNVICCGHGKGARSPAVQKLIDQGYASELLQKAIAAKGKPFEVNGIVFSNRKPTGVSK